MAISTHAMRDPAGTCFSCLAYCGLPWEPRRPDFSRAKRRVRSARATWWRRPIFKKSAHRRNASIMPLPAELS
jgi:hypothetical protein